MHYSFDEIIVHCGANYLNTWYTDDDISSEISELLGALGDLFKCNIVFSPILPMVTIPEQLPENRPKPLLPESQERINRICHLNSSIYRFCSSKGFFELHCPEFMSPFFKHLLCKDGCHLNRNGIVAMEHMLIEYIKFRYSYDRNF